LAKNGHQRLFAFELRCRGHAVRAFAKEVDRHSPVLEPFLADHIIVTRESEATTGAFGKNSPKVMPTRPVPLGQIDRATDANVVEMRIEEAVGCASTA
jgi:hypothetical protein